MRPADPHADADRGYIADQLERLQRGEAAGMVTFEDAETAEELRRQMAEHFGLHGHNAA